MLTSDRAMSAAASARLTSAARAGASMARPASSDTKPDSRHEGCGDGKARRDTAG